MQSTTENEPSTAKTTTISVQRLKIEEVMKKDHYLYENVSKISYQKPEELTSFSFDKNRNLLLNDLRSLNYYLSPNLNSDLNHGFPESYIQRDPTINEHLDALLASFHDFNLKTYSKFDPDFVTWRGIMTKFMCTPYSSRDEWEMNVCLFKNTIYIEESESIKIGRELNQTEKDDRFCFYGYKFESICTYPTPKSSLLSGAQQENSSRDDSNTSRDFSTFQEVNRLEQSWKDRINSEVNTNVEFCSVFKSKLGSHSLLMGAEVDCLYTDKDVKDSLDRSNYYAELKTNRVITHPKQKYNFFKYKMLRVWVQSYLAGIPTIIIGYRDDDGILRKLERMNTSDIPRIVRNFETVQSSPRNSSRYSHSTSNRYSAYSSNEKDQYGRYHQQQKQFVQLWDPQVCFNFVDRLLSWIKERVVEDDRLATYRLYFKHPFTHIELEGPFYEEKKVFIPNP